MEGKSVLFISVPNLIIELKEAMSRSQLTAYKRKFEKYDFDVMLTVSTSPLRYYLEKCSDWKIYYSDDMNYIFVKA